MVKVKNFLISLNLRESNVLHKSSYNWVQGDTILSKCILFTQVCLLKPDKPEEIQKVTMHWHGLLPTEE